MRIIDTTYVMRLDVLDILQDAETKTGKDREELITLCIRKMLKDYKRYLREMQRIEYQKRIDETTGLPVPKTRVKVRFWIREYNYFQDVRKFFFRSISLAIAIAIFTYLEQVIAEILCNACESDAGNYPYDSYAFVEKCIENITTFRIWWGLPPNLATVLEQ